jgi:anaerobic dimethyl sulfoxide reductase subunit C (anchor subunit)
MGPHWPLVVFTLLLQAAAGLLIVSELLALAGDGERPRGSDILGFLLGLVGLGASFAHLGMPWHSPYALFNIGSSWLSREIFCTSAFIGCLFVLAVCRRVPAVRKFVGPFRGLAVLTALTSLAAMSMVYRIVTVPAWDSPATPLNFAATTLLLGVVLAGLFVAARAGAQPPLARSAGLLLVLLVLAVLAKAIELPLGLFDAMQENARGISGFSAVMAEGSWLYLLRVALLVIGAALAGWSGLRALRGVGGSFVALAIGAVIVVAAGEIIGRFAFFDLYVLNGM